MTPDCLFDFHEECPRHSNKYQRCVCECHDKESVTPSPLIGPDEPLVEVNGP